MWHLMAKPSRGSLSSYVTEAENNPHSKEMKGIMLA